MKINNDRFRISYYSAQPEWCRAHYAIERKGWFLWKTIATCVDKDVIHTIFEEMRAGIRNRDGYYTTMETI